MEKNTKKIQDIILYGSDEEKIKFSYDDGYETYTTKKSFEGVINNLERRYLKLIVNGKEKYHNIKVKQTVKSVKE